MFTKKSLACALLLVGCTTSVPVTSLRDPSLLRDEWRLQITHAQVQQALFRHARHCGKSPTFSLHAHSTNDATIVHAFSDPPQISRTVLIDLQQVYGWNGPLMVAKAYANAQVSADEVKQVFQAVLDPLSCSVL